MDSPLISVVIPVYNGSNYMREAVESVLAQTYTNYEILLIDDGSKDNTWEIIQEYVQKYPDKIRGFHKENGGVSTALNLGIAEMKGEWFAWLSHDDLWLPEKLEKQVAFMNLCPSGGLYYSGYYYINETGDILEAKDGAFFPSSINVAVLLGKNYINGITVLIRKDCLDAVGGFDTQYRCVQDWDLWIKIALKYDIYLLPEKLAKNRLHSSQTGAKIPKKCLKEEVELRKKYSRMCNVDEVFRSKGYTPSLYDTPFSTPKYEKLYLKYGLRVINTISTKGK